MSKRFKETAYFIIFALTFCSAVGQYFVTFGLERNLSLAIGRMFFKLSEGFFGLLMTYLGLNILDNMFGWFEPLRKRE
ncbi:MAG: hypothetical protein ACLFVB_10670 [Thermoplasmata archaeon]